MKKALIVSLLFICVETMTICSMSTNFNIAISDIESRDLQISDLKADLNTKVQTIQQLQQKLDNANNIISEMEDDIKSIETVYQNDLDYLEQYQVNAYLEVNKYKEEIEYLKTLIPEDTLFLTEYVANGGEIVDIGTWKCTAYCTEKYRHICGTGTGITASGREVVGNWSVAINKANLDWLPFGTHVYIEGVGEREIMDTGPGVATNQFDCAGGTHKEALAWKGAGNHRAWILK